MARTSVLVVDDEESMRYFLTRALGRKGYRVEAVGTGEEAVARFADRPSDVVLLDLRLPGRDGIEVLKEIKSAHPDTIVLMMTGYGTVERALEAMHAGAEDFVTKPVRIEDVTARIEDAKSSRAQAHRAAPTPEGEAKSPALRMPPPRPLIPYVVEAAETRGIKIEREEGTEGGDVPYREALRLFEILYFVELLERTGGNVSLAARIAGVSRPSLHRKIHDLGIDVDRYRKR